MDPPLEPPLRVVYKQEPVPVPLGEAQLVIQRFVDHAKASSSETQDGSRGTSSIVLGQLQRLSDSLAKEQSLEIMSKTGLVTLIKEPVDDEELEKKREEAINMLSQKLRAEGSQTIDEYCGLTEEELRKLVTGKKATPAKTSIATNTGLVIEGKQTSAASKRISPDPNDSSPEKRSRSSAGVGASLSPTPPAAPLIKLMGRGRGRQALTLDHTRSYVSQIHELSQAMRWPAAVFDHTRTGYPPHELFVVSCRFNNQEFVAPEATLTKKSGNELAALQALRSVLAESP